MLVAGLAATLCACGGSDSEADDAATGTEPPGASAAPSTESARTASTVTVATTEPIDTVPPETVPPDTVPPAPLSIDDLRTILPTAAEAGAGFEVDTSGAEIAEDARIFDEESLVACPGLAPLILDPERPDVESAQIKFADTASTRAIEVHITPEPEPADVAASQAEFAELVAGIEACPLIVGEVADIGIYTAIPAIEQLSGPGDQAYRFTLDGDLVNEMMLLPLDFSVTFWERDGVSVIVSATSGIDDALQPVPNDDAALDALVAAVDTRLVGLQR